MEVAATRQAKLTKLQQRIAEQNTYLAEHPRAVVDVARRKIKAFHKKLRLPAIDVNVSERTISMTKQVNAWQEASKLDGCYCLKTDLSKKHASKETVHNRYKDLSQVEWAFRTSKTSMLEARPIYVRLASRTRGHLLVVMLAYLIVRELADCWYKNGCDSGRSSRRTQIVMHDTRGPKRYLGDAQHPETQKERPTFARRSRRHSAQDDRRPRRGSVH